VAIDGRTLALFAAVVVFATTRPVQADSSVELRIATQTAVGSTTRMLVEKSGLEVTKRTAERVRIKFFDAGARASDERDSVRKLKAGQLEGAELSTLGLAMIEESIWVLELPRMFVSVEELDYVADKVWPLFQRKFEKKGFRLIDRSEIGAARFVSNTKIETLVDLRGTKIWQSVDDSVIQAEFKKLALTGIPLGLQEVDAAFASGKIDAAYGTPLMAVTLGWSSKMKYMTSMPLTFSIGATVLTTDAYKKLAPEDGKIFENVARTTSKKARDLMRKANEDAGALLTGKGISVVVTPTATVEEIDKSSSDVWNALAGKLYSKEELKTVLEARAEYRAKHKQGR
jgi:TRAP-type transport system periplasmic protein